MWAYSHMTDNTYYLLTYFQRVHIVSGGRIHCIYSTEPSETRAMAVKGIQPWMLFHKSISFGALVRFDDGIIACVPKWNL